MGKLGAMGGFLPGQKPERNTTQVGGSWLPSISALSQRNPPVPFCSQSISSKCFFNRGVEQAHAGVT